MLRASIWLMVAATTLVVVQFLVDLASLEVQPEPVPTVVSGYSVDAGSA